jgi:hypothetical protein
MISEPAIGSAFFGRENILGVLEKRVNALKGGYRQNIALTGQMLSGKSSIISQFLYTLKDTSLVPVCIEVVEEGIVSFADKFIATLLFNYLASCGKEAGKELPNLMRAAERSIPRTIYAIKRIQGELSRRKHTDAYRRLLNLTSVLKEETGKSCIVILDEFHNLKHLKIKKPYLHFGKIIMIQKGTMYIVSSSQKSTIKKILSEKLALLFGNFETIEVSGFDDKTAKSFLEEKLQNIGLADAHADYLIEFTGGNPFYLDVISKKIAEIANGRKIDCADEDAIVEGLSSVIYNTSGTISQYFTNSIMTLIEKKLRNDYLEILVALALGHNKLKDIAAWFNRKTAGRLSGKLAHLAELDMIYQNGSFFEVRDKVFEFWLRTVYHKKKTALVDDAIERADDFRKGLRRGIAEYGTERRKTVPERVKELFLLFDGETVEIERRRRKLPRFVRIEAQKYGKHEDLLTHQNENKYWVCEITGSRIDEAAISDLITRYYPARDRIPKKICVALEGIDPNALLLAKEKNIWIWDLESINTLFRLYKRHNLVYTR